MSAPDTNVEKQRKRHAFPLSIVKIAMFSAVAILAVVAIVVSDRTDEAAPAETTETSND